MQRQEYAKKWVKESKEEMSERLAAKLAARDLQRENLNVDPIKAQAKIYQALMKERDSALMKEQASENEEIGWCQRKLNYRKSEATITNISVQGITYKNGKNLKLFTTISRGGLKEERDGAQFLKQYGFS